VVSVTASLDCDRKVVSSTPGVNDDDDDNDDDNKTTISKAP